MLDNDKLKEILRKEFHDYVENQVEIYIDGYGDVEKNNVRDHLDSIIKESFDTFIQYLISEVDDCLDNIRFEIDGIVELDDLKLEELDELSATNDFYLSEPPKQHWTLDDYMEKLEEHKDIIDKSEEIKLDDEWEEQEWSKMDEDFI
jgi:hypothetical protein